MKKSQDTVFVGMNDLGFYLLMEAQERKADTDLESLPHRSVAVTERCIGIEPQRIEKAIKEHAELI